MIRPARLLPACVLLLALCPRGGAAEAGAPAGSAALSLAQAEAILIEQNPAIAAARAGLAAAKAGEIIAAYRPNPALTVSAEQFNTAHPFIHLASADPASQGYQHFYTVRVDQLLERGGKRGLRMLGAGFQSQAAEATLQDAIRQQLFQLRQDYLAVVAAKQLLALAQEMLDITAQNETVVKAQVASGGAAEADLLTLQINRLQFQQGLITARQAYVQAQGDLLNVLNYVAHPAVAGGPGAVPPTAAAAAAATGEQLELSDTLDAALREAALAGLVGAAENRADVLSARRAVDAAEAAIKGARALRQEDLDVGLEYQRNGGDNTVGIALQINLPAFNGHQGDIAQAEAQWRQAQSAFQQALSQARTDIGKAHAAFIAALELVRLYTQDTLGKAAESLRIARGVYQEGGTGLLELFQAQQAYAQIMTGAIQARAAYRVALFQLEQATGAPLP